MQNALVISSRPPWFLPSRSFASANHYSLAGTSCRQAGLSTAPPLQIRATRWSTNHFRPENAKEQNRSCPQELVRTLLIDNYDSYTYNIYQELAVVNGVPPIVIHNDEWTWEHAHYYLYKENAFDNIVLSPGPGSPTCPTDIGICLQILIQCKDIPILGVCLGHQALGFAYGAQIVQAPEPVHGRLSEIEHIGCNLFSGIPSGQRSGFKVMRYHSLMIGSELIPEELVPIAWSTSMRTHTYFETQEYGAGLSDADISNDPERSKVLMGLMHRTRPHYGVQFHPESIATSYGRKIFENFKMITVDYGLRSSLQKRKVASACQPPNGFQTKNLLLNKDALTKNLCLCVSPTLTSRNVDAKHLKLKWKKIDFLESQVGGSKNIFCKLFGTENAENTFWLDSSYTDQGRSRFSFMGGKGGSLWKQLTYHLSQRSEMTGKTGGHLSYQDVNGFVKTKYLENGLFDFLDKELKSFHYDKEDFEGLPFDFCGGFIGFIGYDLKVECGALANRFKSAAPDACLFFADNIVAVDHSTGDVYILQVQQTAIDLQSCCKEENTCWLSETERKLLSLKCSKMMAPAEMKQQQQKMASEIPAPFVVDKSKDEYMEDVERCLGFIRDGESYELCLTTQMRMSVGSNLNALDVYMNLREANPAPYAAWLNFSKENLCVCCSSPERFLRLDRAGLLEAKPMKGTIARGSTAEEDHRRKLQLQHSEKEQAENLMIVDVVRNDLGRVCESGSVCGAEGLMAVESYATVHTMVSTVRGTKGKERSAVDCIKAAFPGASMTGAPKLRSMRILDSLEASSRGVYSGSIGFLSYNQTFDLNIVIRTVVLHRGQASIGAGGAVVALSNPEQEYCEMLLKVRAPAAALLHQPSSSPLS